MNMSSKEYFTPNGVGLPFHVQGSPEPLVWNRLVPRSILYHALNPEYMIFESCPECGQYWSEIEYDLQCCRNCEHGNHNNYIDWEIVDKYINMKEGIESLNARYDSKKQMLKSIEANISHEEEVLTRNKREIDRKDQKMWNSLKSNLFSKKKKSGRLLAVIFGLTVAPALATGPLFGFLYLFPNLNPVFGVVWMFLCICVFVISWGESYKDRYYR